MEQIKKIIKRDGRTVDFDIDKIADVRKLFGKFTVTAETVNTVNFRDLCNSFIVL